MNGSVPVSDLESDNSKISSKNTREIEWKTSTKEERDLHSAAQGPSLEWPRERDLYSRNTGVSSTLLVRKARLSIHT